MKNTVVHKPNPVPASIMRFGGVVKLEFFLGGVWGDQGEAGKGKLAAGGGDLDARGSRVGVNWLLVGAIWMRGMAGQGKWLLVGANWLRGVAGQGKWLLVGGNDVCGKI